MRDRMYTQNDEISRSSISMPKMQEYNTHDYNKQNMGRRTDKVREIRDSYRHEYRDFQVPSKLRTSYITNEGVSLQQGRKGRTNDYNGDMNNYRTERTSTLNAVPLI